ncbi:Receptor protein kinase FERONIA [Spatholobus suberectus]|nr:Receptor protein kinase FERONIA [Spatholobus suberectus]
MCCFNYSLSMHPTGTRIALGAILLLLLCLPYLSTADHIYRPHDHFSINCGSSNNLFTPDRNWTGDTKFLSERGDSVLASALTPSTILGPYTSARLSHSHFTYSFPVTSGPMFLRLFFYSTSYQNFDRSKAYFSVKAGPYTLLQDFNTSLNADADDDPGHPDILFREYCINVLEDGQKLNITFIPNTTDSYAFINGIEIVSMPPYLFYTNPDVENTGPQAVGTTIQYQIENNSALETKYRLRVGGATIPSSKDTGMLRTWDADNKYVTTQSEVSVDYGSGIKLNFTQQTPNYTAPDQVYRTSRSMGRTGSINMGFNLTWQLPVDSGFTYMLRLHFCELNPRVSKASLLSFYIFIADQLATDRADVLLWTDNRMGGGGFGHVYKGYIDNYSTPVAIKRLKPGSRQGVHEFVNEIEMLSQLRHVHLVSLIGYCYESNEMLLVYEFMDHGTLGDHLYDTDNPSLSWKQRLQICIGVARGLHYLHTGAKHVIIHRDVKSTNILLDEKWVAKVSDFGLSRIGPTGISTTHVNTQVKGSIGYLDPEYYKRQRLTEKSDVYSFGVVLLEVLSGRQPLLHWEEKQKTSLVNWAKRCCEKGTLREIVDPEMKGQIAPQCSRKFGEVALSCLLEDGTQRPSMNDVVGMLEFVLQLQDSAVNGVMEIGGDYEDSEDMFSNSQSSVHVSDYGNSTGLNTTSNGDRSYGSTESDRLIMMNVFSEIKDPKGR